jgi:hypothetical protein
MAMYEQNYAITDVRDLLGMCVLQFATEAVAQEEKSNAVELQCGQPIAIIGRVAECGTCLRVFVLSHTSKSI